MKKRFAFVLAGAAAMGSFGLLAAHAAPVNSPLGTANVDANGVTLDGASTNPSPLNGYLIVGADGSVTCHDGTGAQPYDDQGNANPNFVNPKQCNPQPPA